VFEEQKTIMQTPGAYAWIMGDVVDNFIVGRLQEQNMKPAAPIWEQWQLAKEYLDRWKDRIVAFVGGNHGCMDEETQVFTDRGWLEYDEVTPNDRILSLDTDDETVAFDEIEAVHRYSSPGHMLHFENHSADMMLTPNHRVLHKRRSGNEWGEYSYVQAKDLRAGRISFPVSGNSDEFGCSVSPEMLRLAGLFIADGWHGDYGRCRISQRESNVELVEQWLESAELEYTVRYRHHKPDSIEGREVQTAEREAVFEIVGESRHRLLGVVDDKELIPDWCWELTDNQFRALFEGFIEGDGSEYDSNGESYAFYNRRPICEQLQALCTKHGFSASLSEYRPGQFRLNICRRKNTQVDFSEWNLVEYDGEVWCLTVPKSNFLVRRNGKAYFTGNSWTMSQTQVDYRRDVCPDGVLFDGDDVQAEVSVGSASYDVWARHKWKGNSIYNQTHGQERAARFNDPNHDLYVGAHTHEGALYREMIHEGQRKAAVQIGTYKVHDDYARASGFPPSDMSTACAVILHDDGSMHGMADLDAAKRYMQAVYN